MYKVIFNMHLSIKKENKKSMKQNTWVLIGILVVAFFVMTADVNLKGLKLEDLWGPTSDLVNVNKQLRFHIIDDYSGGPVASKTDKFGLYGSGGDTIIEADLDTDANGLITTGSPYPSGTSMFLRYEDSNDKQWFPFTVPQMQKSDAEAVTYNIITLEGFTIGTYTTDGLALVNGTTYADASTYNITSDGASPHFKYSLANTGSDNTGLKTSFDTIYNHPWDVELYVTFSGTEYEKLIIHGFSYSFTLGTTHYVGKTLDPYKLTKHYVGTDYKSLGTDEIAFWIDTTGTSASCSVTMQITVKAYASHSYAQTHGGSYGSEAVTIAEHTVTIAGI